MNAYVSLDRVKAEMGIPDLESDDHLRRIIEAKSRDIEGPIAMGATGRVFYSYIATRYLSGNGRSFITLGADLISVTTFSEDTSGAGTYGTTWASTDYWLAPYDHTPTGDVDAHTTKPYTHVEASRGGTKGSFARGRRNFEIVGKWGYCESTKASGSLLEGALDATQTTIVVDDEWDFEVLQTVLIDSEQLYLERRSGVDTFDVVRGVNGTTAATHADDTAVSIIQYPAGVSRAVLVEAIREWQMGQAHYASALGNPDTGEVQIMGGGLRNITKDHLASYRAAPVIG